MNWVSAMELFSLWRLAALVVNPSDQGQWKLYTGDYRLEPIKHIGISLISKDLIRLVT
jgi:hypothetical protein